jgi:hypothetical protein
LWNGCSCTKTWRPGGAPMSRSAFTAVVSKFYRLKRSPMGRSFLENHPERSA